MEKNVLQYWRKIRFIPRSEQMHFDQHARYFDADFSSHWKTEFFGDQQNPRSPNLFLDQNFIISFNKKPGINIAKKKIHFLRYILLTLWICFFLVRLYILGNSSFRNQHFLTSNVTFRGIIPYKHFLQFI